jgi:hypothetical protein
LVCNTNETFKFTGISQKNCQTTLQVETQYACGTEEDPLIITEEPTVSDDDDSHDLQFDEIPPIFFFVIGAVVFACCALFCACCARRNKKCKNASMMQSNNGFVQISTQDHTFVPIYPSAPQLPMQMMSDEQIARNLQVQYDNERRLN